MRAQDGYHQYGITNWLTHLLSYLPNEKPEHWLRLHTFADVYPVALYPNNSVSGCPLSAMVKGRLLGE